MDIETKIFQNKKPNFSKFKTYGLLQNGNCYHFQTDFMNGEFRAIIDIGKDGTVSGSVMDLMNGEEYLPLRICSQNGAYVNSVRIAYENILADIAGNCYEDVFFASDQANRITEQIYGKYGDRPDFPWTNKSDQASGTFRYKENSKWYGLIMNVKKSILDKTADALKVDIINLKINESDGKKLRREAGIYPAYHMNHRLWISVILDEMLPDDRIMELVDESYQLTDRKRTKK